MLDQKDIEILKIMMTEVIKQSEDNILTKVDAHITSSNTETFLKMDQRISASENMILKELDRVQVHLESNVQEVQKNLDDLQQYYKITKLENDNTSLLLKLYNDMQKEIADIKTQIA